ncbi:MAG TPA: UPF0158 family protein [Flavipsychrobacter sp.]|nr:UPF0158 family protein [Flavipsychrobacter sp.]
MALQLTSEQLKSIAQDLESGMVCFYHIKTGEVESYPNDLDDSYAEYWQDVLDKINAGIADYIRFDVPTDHESFCFMADFANDLADEDMRDRFIAALQKRKPFQQFKSLLNYYPDMLEEWYKYRSLCFIRYVKEIVEVRNLQS